MTVVAGSSECVAAASGICPSASRVRSAAMSAAESYRSAGSFDIAVRTTESSARARRWSSCIPGTCDGSTGSSCTCWKATENGDSPSNGGRPVTSS